MSPTMRNGFLVAMLHVALVGSLGAKLVVDRASRPRVWARAAPIDPSLPIRGRYIQLRLEAAANSDVRLGTVPPPARAVQASVPVTLSVRDGQLVASMAEGPDALYARLSQRPGETVAILDRPIAFFISEHAVDPSRRPPGEQLWVEVTVPRHGAPRPIRLGVKKDGVLTPLGLD